LARIFMLSSWQDFLIITSMDIKKKVMIIDDEVDACLLLKKYFTKRNCEVYSSHSLAEGLKQMNIVKPNILFVDNNLPDGFGWELTSYIMNRFPNAEVHLITAYNNSTFDSAAITDNIKMWQKPISFRKLDELLKNAS